MILNKRWYSPEGFILELNLNTHTMRGKLYLPKNFSSKDSDLSGIVFEDEKNHEVAFIINWDTKNSISYTAFKGKINHEGTLLLDWLLSSHGLNSNNRESVSGSSILKRCISELKPSQKISPSLPYPLELQCTPLSSEIFPFELQSNLLSSETLQLSNQLSPSIKPTTI